VGVIPAAVPLELLLARTDTAAVAVANAAAYPTGVAFTLLVRVRSIDSLAFLLSELVNGHLLRPHPGVTPASSQIFQANRLRFGVAFSDGRAATNLTRFSGHRGPDAEDAPSISLTSTGGLGGEMSYEQRWWLWPLPPPGTVGFVCEWPGMGIPESRREIEANILLEATARAIELWPGNPVPQTFTTGETTSSVVLSSFETIPPKAPPEHP
jgi:hypothetical protein